MLLDILLVCLILILIAWSNDELAKRFKLTRVQDLALQALWGYHFIFGLIFYFYIQKNGGDAKAYWMLEADISQGADTWMSHYGGRTFFLQWLNYFPSKVLGLGFLFGNVAYTALSFIGLRVIFLMSVKQTPLFTSKWTEWIWMGIFFLPNLHFWTAGIGKEALLLLGLGTLLFGYFSENRNWILVIFGLALSFWVRPIMGIILFGLTWSFFLLDKNTSSITKFWVSIIGMVTGFLQLRVVIASMHLEELSLNGFLNFSSKQLDFLQGFGAGSEVTMQDYNVFQKFWTVLFRPFWTDFDDFWSLAATVENTIALLFSIIAVFSFGYLKFKKRPIQTPQFVIFGVGMIILIGVVYILTLNNLGIMMRMKSTYMFLGYLYGWVLLSSALKAYRDTKGIEY